MIVEEAVISARLIPCDTSSAESYVKGGNENTSVV